MVGIVKKEEVKAVKGKKGLNVKGFSIVKEFAIEASEENVKEIGSEIGFAELEGIETVGLT